MIDISSCWFCLRLIVAPLLLLLFKWWLVYQHDRSVCMAGNPREVRSWLCGVESSPTKMSCVYACVKNIRKVSRNVWMHFEGGMVSVYIRQKFTLHSWKKNDLNSRSLTFTIPPSRGVVEDDGESFFVMSETQLYAVNKFSAENVLFFDPPLLYKCIGSIGVLDRSARREKMPIHECIYVTDWRNVSFYIKSI